MSERLRSRRRFLAEGAAALALSRSSFASGSVAANIPVPTPLGSIQAGGDLRKRATEVQSRLESDIYRPPLIFEGVNSKSWPGDMEGRALLGMTLISRSTGNEPSYLNGILGEYKKRLNAEGYFGDLLDIHAINEQQLSGHGWFLRGLCEFYEARRDPQALEMMTAVIRNLALPLRGSYRKYPIEASLRTRTGDVSGSVVSQQGNWVLSSDVGCAFIFVDGLSHAWVLTRQPELKALVDEAIGRFLEVDLVKMGAQTHATLTCMRALLRVYGVTGDPALLHAVKERYKLYRTLAMTEHYANYNWFDRPETWTEPCAIFDSFILANQLWQHTGEPGYLEDAHLIWFNGVGRGMRGNGGYGTDLCAGYQTPLLKVRSYEAFFCCSMRAGEGHARAIEYSYSTRPSELTVVFPNDSEAGFQLGDGTLRLRQTAAYPYPGPTRIEVLSSSCKSSVVIRFFAPRWTSSHRVLLNGKVLDATLAQGFITVRCKPKAGDILLLDQELHVGPRETLNPRSIRGYYAFQAGPLMLGHEGPGEIRVPRNAKLESVGPGRYRVAGSDVVLSRINDLNDGKAGPKDPCTRQVLFREA